MSKKTNDKYDSLWLAAQTFVSVVLLISAASNLLEFEMPRAVHIALLASAFPALVVLIRASFKQSRAKRKPQGTGENSPEPKEETQGQ